MTEEMDITVKMADIIYAVFVRFKPKSCLVMAMEMRIDYKQWAWRFDRETFCDLADVIAAC